MLEFMKFNVLLLIFTLIYDQGMSQNIGGALPDFRGQTIETLRLVSGWEELLSVSGDLNADQKLDLAIVLESTEDMTEGRCEECLATKSKPRVLLILLDMDGQQEVILQNNEFIARSDEGGMISNLIPELKIDGGILEISYEFVRSEVSYYFKFFDADMQIVGAKTNGISAGSGDSHYQEFDFYKGIIMSRSGNISGENESNTSIKIKEAPKGISDFGRMFEWEVAEGIFL
ncbi:hypothetical protein [Algoriphagus chordae]|uniref:Uncharacterized protein n=1 Tax=Algoriphagus chordae TaxID=237019 RepID=A0A2W7REL3_9BACT|nr:hypothetical protein [Algoriphagus chordae]PZX49155.1 hypothetical protein LV85_03286 [Algoriphagus chordae]